MTMSMVGVTSAALNRKELVLKLPVANFFPAGKSTLLMHTRKKPKLHTKKKLTLLHTIRKKSTELHTRRKPTLLL